MPHPLVTQLYFTRSELKRSLAGITDEEARRRFVPMNCISWMIGHLAAQEQRYWITIPTGRVIVPSVNELTASGRPATTPPLDEMWEAWNFITQEADPYLGTLTSDILVTHSLVNGNPARESIGSMLRRMTYHYWFHNGESQAVRQLLGHTGLPEFVGAIHADAPYVPENEP